MANFSLCVFMWAKKRVECTAFSMSASDLLPSEYISNGWANCLHLTGKNENSGESSLTSVSLWINKQGLLIRSAHNHWQLPSTDLPIINQWTTVVIDQIQKNDGKHLFSVSIAGKEVFSVETRKPEELVNVKVFASDPRLPAQPGLIRNLLIETGGEFYKILFISCLHLSKVVMF